MLPSTIDLRAVVMPTGSDEEMAFQTFRSYLEAVCVWTKALYPHREGVLAGVATAVKAGRWSGRTTAANRVLTNRGAEILRNGWATEVLLNSPRVVGGAELIGFANLWAPVQAYYAVFNAFSAMAMTLSASRPPKTHATLLGWAATQVGHPASPFVVPWTARVGGAPGTYTFEGFAGAPIDHGISNLVAATVLNAPSLVAVALRTTRRDQIEEHREGWRKGLRTTSGRVRRNLPRAVVIEQATKLRPTTLFDLLYRLRIRSNYKEGDALLSGALGPADAAAFHEALAEIVAATLLITEIYLAHAVGRPTLDRCAAGLTIPPSLRPYSVDARRGLW
jgi:hypothetical protein